MSELLGAGTMLAELDLFEPNGWDEDELDEL